MDVLRTAFQTSLVLEWGATAATALVAIEVSVRLMSGLMPFDCALAVLLLTPEFFCRCGSWRSNIMPARPARRRPSASTRFSTRPAAVRSRADP